MSKRQERLRVAKQAAEQVEAAQQIEPERKTNAALEKLKIARQEVDMRGPRAVELLDEAIRFLEAEDA